MKKKVIIILILSLLVGSFLFFKKSSSKNLAEAEPLEAVLQQAAAYRKQGQYNLALELLNQLISQGEKDPRLLKMWQEILVENGEYRVEQKTFARMRSKLIQRSVEALANKDYPQARTFADSAAHLAGDLTAEEEQQLENIWWQLAKQKQEESFRAQKEGLLSIAQKKLTDLLEDEELLNKLSREQQKHIRAEANRQLNSLTREIQESSPQQQDQASNKKADDQKNDGQSKIVKREKEELTLQDESANQLYTQGVTLYKQGRYEQALETFNRILTQDNPPLRLHYARALSLRQLGQDADAQLAFEEQIKKEAQHSPSLWQLGELLAKKDQTRAEQLFKEAIELKKDDPRYLRSLAALYFNQGRYQLAALYYQRSLKISDDAQDYFNLGVTHLREKNYHAAVSALEQALEKSRIATTEMQLAFTQALYFSGDLQRAEEKLNDLLKEKQDEKALSLLGKVYLEQQNYEQAAESLELALELSARNPSYLNDLALVLIEKKDYEKALSLLNEALSREPRSALFHYNLAKLYLRLEKFEQSLQQLKTSLNFDKQQPEAHLALVELYLQLQQKEAAEKAYEDFKRILPEARELATLAIYFNE